MWSLLLGGLLTAASARSVRAWQGTPPGLPGSDGPATPEGTQRAAETADAWGQLMAAFGELTVTHFLYILGFLVGAWVLAVALAWILQFLFSPGRAARVGLIGSLIAFGLVIPLVFFPLIVGVGLPLLGVLILSAILLIFAGILFISLFGRQVA